MGPAYFYKADIMAKPGKEEQGDDDSKDARGSRTRGSAVMDSVENGMQDAFNQIREAQTAFEGFWQNLLQDPKLRECLIYCCFVVVFTFGAYVYLHMESLNFNLRFQHFAHEFCRQ